MRKFKTMGQIHVIYTLSKNRFKYGNILILRLRCLGVNGKNILKTSLKKKNPSERSFQVLKKKFESPNSFLKKKKVKVL